MTVANSETGLKALARTAGTGFLGKFTVLKGAARELWLTFVVKLLVIAAYALTNLTIVLWLSSEFGYRDQKALGMVAFWSLSMTVVTLLVGPLTDALGFALACRPRWRKGVCPALPRTVPTTRGLPAPGLLDPGRVP